MVNGSTGLQKTKPNWLFEVPGWPITRTENDMYARQVSMELKPDSRKDFTHKIEAEILPLLRKQKGFQDEITFVDPAGKDAFAVSLWDSKENAENYSRIAFAEVTRLLSKLVEGTPRVKSYEVANSTFHKIAAMQKAA
jgi:heme-degrading monooxygenase HmoA